ncbi:YtxH domain-containing protein [Acidipila rosea]|uniref:Gas vesicle protein n=1 Tax=Acidipila rosea TaxID=768535 RepID=A0A4R1L7V6_9BACT|nr:YtxH domain-containing protein [Acidipila rosea]MBW4027177.1 YtxH domain-containing protein [Acidobacteriota bacterium]MBW4045754.1 YtxH domain-containing protein [Acidobacteriota bacterium]TCK74316.1 gas vesicle protein [Acidipila rosea]
MSEEKQSGGFSWFVAGLGIGALLGVLYAPKSGRETRDELVNGACEGKEYLRQRSREAADQVSAYVDRSKSQVNEYVDRSKEAVERGRQQWEEVVARGQQFVNDQSEKVVAAVDAGRQAYKSKTAEPGATAETSPIVEPASY